MSIPSPKAPLERALVKIPETFRKRIIEHYVAAKRALAEGKDEAVGMAAGKLCESVLRFLQDQITSTHTPFSKKIGNFAKECRDLIESSNAAVPESLRVVMPRALASCTRFEISGVSVTSEATWMPTA